MFQDDAHAQRVIQQNQRLVLLDNVTRKLNEKQDRGPGQAEMAKAVNKELINLRVPYAYRYNAERYLRVARLMPLREATEERGRYRRRLQKMLLDPADTVRAALRLEALGKESVPALKRGLESEQPLVRFTSAEALAYLGSTSGVDELARLAEQQPDLQRYCLLALSGLDEGICRTKLGEMLTMDDVSLRCGAFRACGCSTKALPGCAKSWAESCWANRIGFTRWLPSRRGWSTSPWARKLKSSCSAKTFACRPSKCWRGPNSPSRSSKEMTAARWRASRRGWG